MVVGKLQIKVWGKIKKGTGTTQQTTQNIMQETGHKQRQSSQIFPFC